MKTLVILVGLLFATSVWAGDAFRTYGDDNPEYGFADKSLTRDFDNDGLSNAVDPYDNDWHRPQTQRDYDHDGIPNAVDGYDNDWYKP